MPGSRGNLRALAALAVLSASFVACSRPTPLPPGGVVPPGPAVTPGGSLEQVPPGPVGVEVEPLPQPGEEGYPYSAGVPAPTSPYPAPQQTETAEAGGS